MQVTTSVVISVLDDSYALRATVESVLNGGMVPSEIIVIDDGSRPALESIAEPACHEGLIHYFKTERRGVARARNLGARLTTGRNLIFMDSHCLVERSWLQQLVDGLAALPRAVLAPSVRGFGDDMFGCGARIVTPQLKTRWIINSMEGEHVPMVPGGCMAMRRTTFFRLGQFYPFRELGLEDVEFSLRAWRMGTELVSVNGARLSHRFSDVPTYSLNPQSRGYNLAVLALMHFTGERRHQCLSSIIGGPRASETLVDALASGWEHQRTQMNELAIRSIAEYFERHGDW